MPEQLKQREEQSTLATLPFEEEMYIEESPFLGDDGQGPASDPDEDEDLTGDPDADDAGSRDGKDDPPPSQ